MTKRNGWPLAISSWGSAEVSALERLADSGAYTMGEAVATFEHEFAAFVGSRYCVMVNSGSSANLLAVAALCFRKESPLQRGDEVIVPAVSWATTYAPLQQYGFHLKFVDIDGETWNYDLNALKRAVSDETRLIMAVNLLGNPNDFTRIRRIISNRPITLIEDNCEAMGATFDSRQTGTFGLLGTFSTYFSHHISTMEGGMVVTDDEEMYALILALRSHGWTRHLSWPNPICTQSPDPFDEKFRFILPGYNVRPMEISGALGTAQLEKLPRFIRTRRENAAYFRQSLEGHPELAIQKELGESSWFGFGLVIRDGSKWGRSDVLRQLAQHRIESRPVMGGLFLKHEAMRFMDYEVCGGLRNAKVLDQGGFYLGNFAEDLRPQIDNLVRLLGK